MKYFYLLIAFFVASGVQSQGVIELKELIHDGENRSYEVFIPSSYTGSTAYPVVLNFHGLGSNSVEQRLYSNFNTTAEAENIIIVHPQGLARNVGGSVRNHWNTYFGTGVDDLGFVDALLDQLIEDYNIDIYRIYSTGMSNGGFMSYMLACELSDRIAAIASVTGTMSTPQIGNCSSGVSVAVMQIHGTADGTVPFDGIPLLSPSVPDVVEFWKDKMSCSSYSGPMAVADINTADNSTASYEIYKDCEDEKEVVFYTVDNGGHSWPGSFPVPGLGNTNQDFDATETIWDFFKRHRHKDPRGGSTSSDDILIENVVAVSPNPTNGILQIRGNTQKIKTVQLLDMTGRLLEIRGDYSEINISQVQNGMYVMKIQFENSKVQLHRIVKI